MRILRMDTGVHFRIRILSPHRCEVREHAEGWTKQFASVKGALDFVEAFQGAKVQITDECRVPHARKKHFSAIRAE